MKIISVLIPTFNAEKYIFQLISSIKSQELDPSDKLEILIIDSSSTDNTIGILNEKFPDVKVENIENKCFDHGGTRNQLAALANGEYLLFMTQDAIPVDRYLIKNLLKSFEETQVVISFARQIPKEEACELERFARNFNYPDKSIIKGKDDIKALGIKTFFNSNVCSMYSRKAFDQLGGFPEKIILNEDMIFSSKAIFEGYYVSYSAQAKVYHSHNYNFKQQFKRYFDIGMAFDQTKYLLEYASNEKEGRSMVKKQIKHLMSKGLFGLIAIALIENILKYTGYLIGKNHRYIPLKFKKRFSAYMK